MKKQSRGQDVINLFLGIWAFLTPWAFGYHLGVAVANYVIVGILITFFSGATLVAFRTWEEGINIVLGAWLLGFRRGPPLVWSAVVIGALVILCSAIGLIKGRSGGPLAK